MAELTLDNIVARILQSKSAAPLLPALFSLRGQPYMLDDHFVFEEMYLLKQPTQTVFMTGRQVGKTTNLAVHNILLAATNPHMTIVIVTPLAEQVSRISTMYVAALLKESPIGKLLVGPEGISRVLHREFTNNSRILFTYAFLDATRVRGIPGSRLVIDEAQDMMLDLLPTIREVISHSQFGQQELYSGTPKTTDNTLAVLWEQSSQAEWFIPCTHCTTGGTPTWNIPSPEFHLERMLGPAHDNISERYPGTICYKCGQPISPRQGRWVHKHPSRRWYCAGYHIPQPIMPYYYAKKERWARLLAKQRGVGPTPVNMFYNEVLGWPYDLSASLLTEGELRDSACLVPNTDENAGGKAHNYRVSAFGIDWGGGGEKGVSLTTIAFAGMRHDGIIEVIWGKKLLTPHDHIGEAVQIYDYFRRFTPTYIAHDYGGGGALRETILIQAGVDQNRVLPMLYTVRSGGWLCSKKLTASTVPREHYIVDKTRAIQLVCSLIRLGRIRFFAYDYVSPDEPGLLRDFLSLSEEKTATSAGEVYRINRHPAKSDDFAQAVVYACMALWQITQNWPDVARSIGYKMSQEQYNAVFGTDSELVV